MKQEKLGKISSDLAQKTPDSVDPIEIQRATEKEYIDNLIWCVKHAQKQVDCSDIDGHADCINRSAWLCDFFIVVLLKKEKLMSNVLRTYFIPTLSCPTPTFDQTVYKYNHDKQDVEFLWVVPDKDTSETFLENKSIIVPEEQELLKFVLKYYDGTLFNLAKKLNGETYFAGSALEGK